MDKLIGMIAGILAVSFCGVAGAAEKDAPAMQPQAGQPADPAAGGASASKREQEYLAALKKCEPMTGAGKSKCIEAARRKYGQL